MNHDALDRAKALLPPERLAKAEVLRLRHQRRQERLRRLQAESAAKRAAALADPVARALAKAKAIAARNGAGG